MHTQERERERERGRGLVIIINIVYYESAQMRRLFMLSMPQPSNVISNINPGTRPKHTSDSPPLVIGLYGVDP